MAAAELKREWFFTPRAEWISWQDPDTGKFKGFRVILLEEKRFLEWSEQHGIAAGASDDGEKPGRAKMSAVLEVRPGMEAEVVARVRALVEDVRRDPPRLHGVKIELPEELLAFIADVVSGFRPPA